MTSTVSALTAAASVFDVAAEGIDMAALVPQVFAHSFKSESQRFSACSVFCTNFGLQHSEDTSVTRILHLFSNFTNIRCYV